jgi:hypothetical protein
MWEFSNEWGGIVGIIGGVAGGAYGSYCSNRNTAGPRERACRMKGSLWTLLVMLGMAIGLGYAWGPSYRLSISGLILLPLVIGIPIGQRRLAHIRAEESQEKPKQS